jgi:hypothetical protein
MNAVMTIGIHGMLAKAPQGWPRRLKHSPKMHQGRTNDEGLVEEHTLESIWSKDPEAHLAKYSDYPMSLGK